MKTVIHAVIELRGEWPFEYNTLCSREPSSKHYMFTVNDIELLNNYDDAREYVICTYEEFNQCVDEMSKAEWMKPVTVPVYTQEMADECVSPSVGMTVMIDASFSGENGQSFRSRVEDTILGFINGKGIFKDHTTTLDRVVVVDKMYPVTPLDGKAYQFDYGNTSDLIGVYAKENTEFRTVAGYYAANNCTNIQLLEVTK